MHNLTIHIDRQIICKLYNKYIYIYIMSLYILLKCFNPMVELLLLYYTHKVYSLQPIYYSIYIMEYILQYIYYIIYLIVYIL